MHRGLIIFAHNPLDQPPCSFMSIMATFFVYLSDRCPRLSAKLEKENDERRMKVPPSVDTEVLFCSPELDAL